MFEVKVWQKIIKLLTYQKDYFAFSWKNSSKKCKNLLLYKNSPSVKTNFLFKKSIFQTILILKFNCYGLSQNKL